MPGQPGARVPLCRTLRQFHESLTLRNASSTASADPLLANTQATCADFGRGGHLQCGSCHACCRRVPVPRRRRLRRAAGGGCPCRFRLRSGQRARRTDRAGGARDCSCRSSRWRPGSDGEPASAGHARADGADSGAEMSLPTLIGRDGRRAIPAFTCMEALAMWRQQARPVPAVAAQVWRAAAEDACAVVVDIAGPVPLAIDGARLAALADGRPVPLAAPGSGRAGRGAGRGGRPARDRGAARRRR